MGRKRLYVRPPQPEKLKTRRPTCRLCGGRTVVNFRTGRLYLECADCRNKGKRT